MGRAGKVLAASLALLVIGGIAYNLYTLYTAANSIRVTAVYPLPGFNVGVPSSVKFAIVVENPSGYTLELDRVTYDVYIEGEYVGSGVARDIVIPPHSKKAVYTTFSPCYGGLAMSLSKALKAAAGKGAVEYRVAGTADIPIKLFGTVKTLTISVPYSQSGNIRVSLPAHPSLPRPSQKQPVSVSVTWLAGGRSVWTVKPGTHVEAVVTIKGTYRGYITVYIRQDRKFLPDKTIASKTVYVDTTSTGYYRLAVPFTAEGGLTVRGYFAVVKGSGISYEMPSTYPPRLKVSG